MKSSNAKYKIHDEDVATLEKTVFALAQSLENGYKIIEVKNF